MASRVTIRKAKFLLRLRRDLYECKYIYQSPVIILKIDRASPNTLDPVFRLGAGTFLFYLAVTIFDNGRLFFFFLFVQLLGQIVLQAHFADGV
jgi:hypothetical protein